MFFTFMAIIGIMFTFLCFLNIAEDAIENNPIDKFVYTSILVMFTVAFVLSGIVEYYVKG